MFRAAKNLLGRMLDTVIDHVAAEDVEITFKKLPHVLIQGCACGDHDEVVAYDDFKLDMNFYLDRVVGEDVRIHVADHTVPFTVSRHPDCREFVRSPHADTAFEVRDVKRKRHLGYYWNREDADNHAQRNPNYKVSRIHVVNLDGCWHRFRWEALHIHGKPA